MKKSIFLKSLIFILPLAIISCRFDFMGENPIDHIKRDMAIEHIIREWGDILNFLKGQKGIPKDIFDTIKKKISRITDILKNNELTLAEKDKIIEALKRELELYKDKDIEKIKKEYEDKLGKILDELDKILNKYDKDNTLYNYRDYSKFYYELSSLKDRRIKELGKNKQELEKERNYLFENYIKKTWYGSPSLYDTLFVNYDFYTSSYKIDAWSLKYNFKQLKNMIETLENLDKNKEITNLNLSELNIPIRKSFKSFYSTIYSLMIGLNHHKIYKIKEMYPEFDILFVKEALAKGTKILIYHFPSLYNDFSWLFLNSDKYFQ